MALPNYALFYAGPIPGATVRSLHHASAGYSSGTMRVTVGK